MEFLQYVFEIVQINVYDSPLYQVFVFTQQIFLKAIQYLFYYISIYFSNIFMECNGLAGKKLLQ